MEEIWKTIKQCQFIQVSNLGNVRKIPSLEPKMTYPNNGYMNLKIYKSKTKKYLVHRLVAESFIPNPLNKPQINHIDFNRSNNNINNLEWCTAKENSHHSIINGRRRTSTPRGSMHHKTHLTEQNVIEIRHLHAQIRKYKPILTKYSITQGTLCKIINRKLWTLI